MQTLSDKKKEQKFLKEKRKRGEEFGKKRGVNIFNKKIY